MANQKYKARRAELRAEKHAVAKEITKRMLGSEYGFLELYRKLRAENCPVPRRR